MDGVNEELFVWAKNSQTNWLHQNGLPDLGYASNVAALFDLSHGAGLLPAEWPSGFPGRYCGYAGGLSPVNVAAQLDRVAEVAGGPFWVDAETHLRSGDDQVFDLARVESFLAAASEWARRRDPEEASP